jgi:tRNA 2-thiouridine synthesizing protein A
LTDLETGLALRLQNVKDKQTSVPRRQASMGDIQSDKVLDVRGWSCPWCILKAKSWLRRMNPGQTLEVLSTDPNVLKNFPLVLERTKDRVIHTDQSDECYRIWVKRGNEEEGAQGIASMNEASNHNTSGD